MVSSPRISIGLAGSSTGTVTMRGEAGLPRRVTPVGGPGTRVRTYMQAPGQTWYGEGHAKKEVGVGRGRTGGSVRVERRGDPRVFVCLVPE